MTGLVEIGLPNSLYFFQRFEKVLLHSTVRWRNAESPDPAIHEPLETEVAVEAKEAWGKNRQGDISSQKIILDHMGRTRSEFKTRKPKGNLSNSSRTRRATVRFIQWSPRRGTVHSGVGALQGERTGEPISPMEPLLTPPGTPQRYPCGGPTKGHYSLDSKILFEGITL